MVRKIDLSSLIQFSIFSLILVSSILISCFTEKYYFLAAPLLMLGIYLAFIDIKFIFYVLLFFIPLSIEMELPGGFGTDFPDELLMVLLMGLTFIYLIYNPAFFNKSLLYNPIILCLAIHFLWILFTTISSSFVLVSVKFSLAKIWYLTVFVILMSSLIKSIDDYKKIFWIINVPLLFTVLLTLYRHSLDNFSFASVNHTMYPFYRNHVSYAAILSIWIPFVWLARSWYNRGTIGKYILNIILVIDVVALYFSYTRSAWLGLIAAIGITFIIRFRLMKWVLSGAAIAAISFIIYIKSNYKYIEYAPNFSTTIYHEELGDHLTSTYEMKDLSSAERLYRWVAGFRMWEANPLVGYGPGNFYNFYKGYTVNAFKTYVSDNPEKSTAHNYFILVLVEQGIIGLLIFLLLTATIFIYAEKLYHKCNQKADKLWILAIIMSLAALYVNNSLSDMIETDKVGTFYFMSIAMLAVLGFKYYPSKEINNSN
jgi:O-antigen ligase